MPILEQGSGRGAGRRLPMPLTKELGKRIKSLRETARPPLSQAEAASRMGITASALSQLEAGNKLPSLSTLFRIQDAFDLATIEQLFGDLPSRAAMKGWSGGRDGARAGE